MVACRSGGGFPVVKVLLAAAAAAAAFKLYQDKRAEEGRDGPAHAVVSQGRRR